MTLKQALKLKNKMVQELNDLTAKLHANNSIIEGNTRAYSTSELLAQIYTVVDDLTALKTQIHQANTPVYDKIFLLSELKSLVKNLKNLDCTEGVSIDYFSRRNDAQVIKTAEIGVVQRDMEVKFLESRIDQIQEELDQFNVTTHIEGFQEEISE
jgi:hypothetical protein